MPAAMRKVELNIVHARLARRHLPERWSTNQGQVCKSKPKSFVSRADAMRLKQEVAKRMAEAYELEAKMLSAEAKQFNE
jgi:hypothetical protein